MTIGRELAEIIFAVFDKLVTFNSRQQKTC